jgi:hypothetical protein
MRQKKVLRITAIVLGIVVAIAGGYVFWQYRTSRPLTLESIPTYTSAVPTTDIPEPQRSDAERQLRDLASTGQPGYRVVGERFLATNVEFVWDALRHQLEPYLGSAGYSLDRDGWSSDYMSYYSSYRHEGWLRRRFNDDAILVADLAKTTLRTSTGEDVHLYGYFRLTPG